MKEREGGGTLAWLHRVAVKNRQVVAEHRIIILFAASPCFTRCGCSLKRRKGAHPICGKNVLLGPNRGRGASAWDRERRNEGIMDEEEKEEEGPFNEGGSDRLRPLSVTHLSSSGVPIREEWSNAITRRRRRIE